MLVLEGNAFYEIDEDCLKQKEAQEDEGIPETTFPEEKKD